MDGLSGNDLEYFIQIEGRGNDRGDSMHGGEFVNLAPQLFVGLLIQAPIFDVDSHYSGHDLYKVSLLAAKFAQVDCLHADNADQSLSVAKEDDGYCHQSMIFGAIGANLRREMGVGQGIAY